MSWRSSSLFSWPLWSSSPYTLPLHLVRVALFSPFVQFSSSTALLTGKKKSLSLLRLLLGSTSRESQQCTFSMNNIGSRSMHYLPLSLSLKCVSLVSADLLKKLWTGAWISINHFNWNKQCLINRIFFGQFGTKRQWRE